MAFRLTHKIILGMAYGACVKWLLTDLHSLVSHKINFPIPQTCGPLVL